MAELGTLDRLAAEVSQALLPLREAVVDPDEFSGLLQRLGWHAPTVPQPLLDLADSVETLYDALLRLLGDTGLNAGGAPSDQDSESGGPDEVARVFAALQRLVSAIRAIANAPTSAFPAHLLADGFLDQFPRQLLDHLVITYLRRFHPTIGFALRVAGVITARLVPATGNRPSYVREALDLSALPRLLSDPAQVLRDAYDWGTADLDYTALATEVDNLFMSVGLDVRIKHLSPAAEEAVGGAATNEFDPATEAVAGTIFDFAVSDTATSSADLRFVPVPAVNGSPPGVALLPAFTGALAVTFPLGADLEVTVTSDLDLAGGIALVARPGESLDLVFGFESDTAPVVHGTGSIEAVVRRAGADTDHEPTILLGSPGRTRLQFRRIAGTGGVRVVGTDVDAFVELEVRGLELVFRPDDADSFIASVVPDDGFSIAADLAVGLSHQHGFYFRGTSGLEIQLPVRKQVGPVELQGLTVSATPDGGTLPVALGASFTVRLGPITAVVDKIGLAARFAGKPDQDGNLGPVDVSLGFKPPTGVGITVGAAGVSGGGFLSFDPARGEYAGALELELADFLAVKAIGLITTRQPDGSPGFSLLLVLAAEFPTGLQLGAGFTLLAVGGLIGLNRRMDLQALVEGVRTGAIESVAFPKDVVANAPRILSDLNRFFPAEQGTLLIGPMVKIGWGTPTLISVSLGVVIEVPGDIAVLGVVRAALPTADQPLLLLQAQFVGALEFSKSRAWFFAKLFESRILGVTVDGGMGVLVAWGDARDLIITVGGFHPSFRPPPLPFPVPDRLAVSLLNRSNQLVRLTGYFALTPNTIQFGGDVEVRLGFSAFRVEGHLGLDGLIQRFPFRFTAHSSSDVSLKVFGVGVFTLGLDFTLEGPTPWRAHGRGSIGFLFFSVSADFDITWGSVLDLFLPLIDVLGLLAGELDKPEGWETRLPSGGRRALVSLRSLPETDDLVLHPLGTLVVTQRALPLNVRVDRVGGQRANDGRRFSVAPVGNGLTRAADTGDRFAMAQFQDMSDAAKLSRPSYETQDAGLELTAASGTLATARVVRRAVRYELHIVGDDAPVSALAATQGKRFHSVSAPVFEELRRADSTSRAPLSARQARRRQPFSTADTVRVDEQRFVVAYVKSNRQAFPPGKPGRRSAAATFRSRATAAEALADFVSDDPTLTGRLHVIPAAEAASTPGVPGTWSPAGTLPVAVSTVDLVTLPSGAVLLAGGTDVTGAPVAATALFDPTSDSWTAGPSLGAARQRHTTTRLADGRVLVAGGSAASASAEVFDPAARRWTPTPAMTAVRHGHTATRLLDDRVLVAGGTDARGAAVSTAELYDPVTGTWTATGPMTDARADHQAVPLRGGQVLVVGGLLPSGDGRATALAYCEIYDPATGEWTPTGSLAEPRAGHQAVPLPNGRVLVTGGDPFVAADGTFDPHSLASVELFDPATGTWHPVRPMPGGGRSGHRALTLRSGAVLVTGGTGAPEKTAGYRSVLVFDAGTWTTLGGLLTGRGAHAITELTDDRVLVAAGTAAGTGEVLIP